MSTPFTLPNIRLFILFRVLFNARFYYPVFAILFLDMGLTLEQFFVLNAAWAVAIVGLEVPSGAFADTFGRRNLVVLASVCMVVEMCILCFVPLGNNWVVFAALLLNRLISGAAEAFASGADEALAFDTLKEAGLEAEWPKVLDVLMRWQSAAFVVAMLLGGVLYDATVLSGALGLLGLDVTIAPQQSLRFPLYLTLATALLSLLVTLQMREVEHAGGAASKSAGAAFQLVWETGRWILKTPVVLVIIAAALTFDSTARVIITINSEYYRLIQIPEAAFGLLGALMGLMGIALPILARKLVEKKSPLFNWTLVALVLALALSGMAFTLPYWGLIPALGIGLSMMLLAFFTSHYLNQNVTDSSRRATVLSFRSLATNLAYGAAGLLYMGFTLLLREQGETVAEAGASPEVFSRIISWTPVYYISTVIVLALFAHFILKGRQPSSRA